MNYKNPVPVAAHRGNSIAYPENTLPAFQSALDINADMIEFDLHMTKDGEIVVIHDHTVDRTTSGTGLVKDKTLEEIKALDAGSWKAAQFKGVQIPTFIEFLELVKDNKDLLFNIEFKDYPKTSREWACESADKSIALMEQYGIVDRSVINSWSGELLEYIDEKYQHKYKLHGYFPFHLMGQNQKRSPYDYMFCICLFSESEDPVVDKSEFDRMKENGVEPWVYYRTEEEKDYFRAVENGAVLFTANDPVKAMQILRSKGLHK